MKTDTALCWLRRDLRLNDNAALEQATRHHQRVVCVFVFDQQILAPLPRRDRRVEFIWHAVRELKQRLQAMGSDLLVLQGQASEQICSLARQLSADCIIAAEDYEPAARQRDQQVAEQLATQGQRLILVKDQVIFAKDDILTKSGTPYSVFTPYKRAWLARLTPSSWIACQSQTGSLAKLPATPLPPLAEIGFDSSDLMQLDLPVGEAGGQQLLQEFTARLDLYQHRAYHHICVLAPSAFALRWHWQQNGAEPGRTAGYPNWSGASFISNCSGTTHVSPEKVSNCTIAICPMTTARTGLMPGARDRPATR